MKEPNEPKQLTVEEARERFIVHLWHLVDYWSNLEPISRGNPEYGIPDTENTPRRRLQGLMHSFLASGLDGASLGLPAMEIKPLVSKEDIEFYKTHEEDPRFPIPRQWFPPGEDIGGNLHELMYSIGRKHGFVKPGD